MTARLGSVTPYGQYCPIWRTAEVLGDRWTIHIVRDLLTGSRRFNELVRGNPGLSRALLSRRLRQLQAAGLVTRTVDGSYQLTDAGRDLEPVVFGMATWRARWTFGVPAEEELDPDLLMWWLHRQMDPTVVDDRHFTIYVQFSDHPSATGSSWTAARRCASPIPASTSPSPSAPTEPASIGLTSATSP